MIPLQNCEERITYLISVRSVYFDPGIDHHNQTKHMDLGHACPSGDYSLVRPAKETDQEAGNTDV